ncbi:hypothetical protein ACQP2Y_21240 [Actinoplanes sp. CA-051413]|uniref:hypothetical protein n=1 Tax=Actinoplanes sp. CA-051413 TaxID=3239899 RepID=UPI003D9653C2
MTSQHRYTNRNYRPADDEYDPAKAAFEAAGHNMNVAVRAFLRWINEDPRRVAEFSDLMQAIDDETPRGRPKKKAPPAE